MVKALSLDLRVRVLTAVADGMSHHAVAQVFPVIPASVSRWRKPSRKTGELRAKNTGGDNSFHHVEAHRDLILILLESCAAFWRNGGWASATAWSGASSPAALSRAKKGLTRF